MRLISQTQRPKASVSESWLEQEQQLAGEQITRLAVMATVVLSIFAHGISALPGIRLHARLTGKSVS